jgi:hypothetical protein
VVPVDAQDRASANAVANDVAAHVVGLVNDYYNIGFLRPSRWSGGTFPDFAGLFTPDARGSVVPNLAILTLGPVATVLGRVDPSQEHAGKVSVLIEPNQSASYATVSTYFEATGTPTDKNAGPVRLAQSAQFMIDVGAGYKIAGYDITTQLDSVAKTASYHSPNLDLGALAALGGPR